MGKPKDVRNSLTEMRRTVADLRKRLASGELAEDDPELPARFAQMADDAGRLLLDMLAGDHSPRAEAMRKEIEEGKAELAPLRAN